jgi:uncharacterized membrane protein
MPLRANTSVDERRDPAVGATKHARAAAPPSPEGRGGRILDLVFLLGVALKLVDGFVEVIGGLLLLVIGAAALQHYALAFALNEVLAHPGSIWAKLAVDASTSLTAGATHTAAFYLILHGVVKLAIVVALWFGSTRVYPWVIVVLSGFLVWQVVQLVVDPTIGWVVFTVIDAIVIVLAIREWREHRSLRAALRSVFHRERGARSKPAAA